MTIYPDDVLRAVRDVTGLGPDYIREKKRDKAVVKARHLAVWGMRAFCSMRDGNPLAYEKIGIFVDRDHNSVRNGVLKVDRGAYGDAAEKLVEAIKARTGFALEKTQE